MKTKNTNAIPTNHRRPWCNLNLLCSVRNKTGEEEDEVTFLDTRRAGTCARCVSGDSVFYWNGPREEMYSFYTHSCRPFIQFWFFCSAWQSPNRKPPFFFFSLLSTENPNKLLLLIRLMLIWSGLSLNSLKLSTHKPICIKHTSNYAPFVSESLCLLMFNAGGREGAGTKMRRSLSSLRCF